MPMEKKKQKLIVILGPTASGKTGLSIELAKALDTEIISGDSMLMYRGFNIGSAKPTQEEMQGIKHHLVDCLEPEARFNVTDFVSTASQIIAELNERGKVPIICGGTGLYIKSLLEGYQFNSTGEDAEYRARLEALAAEKGNEFVHSMLSEVNPKLAAELHPNNLRRVIRALEVYHIGGEQLSTSRAAAATGSRKADQQEQPPTAVTKPLYGQSDGKYVNSLSLPAREASSTASTITISNIMCNDAENSSTYNGAAPVTDASSLVYDAKVIGIQWNRAQLYERINQRVDIMMEQGLLQEVANLLAAGISPDCQAMQGIGYRDMVKYLQSYSAEDKSEEARQALAVTVDNIKKNTRHFAKRQLTWYRKMPYIKWLDLIQCVNTLKSKKYI